MFQYLKLLLFEKWKDVVGYEKYYQISNFGRVRSLDRIEVNANGITRNLKGSNKNTFIGRDGYVLITLSKNGINKAHLLHRLVAEAFIPNPNNLDEVNHKDRNRKNCILSNLQWCTSRENTHHARNKMMRIGKYVGVTFNGRYPQAPWISRININGKTKYLGRFETEERGYEAYKLECKKNNIKINSL
jgi:hypothetical protein